jgi:hypothetical protein
MSGEELREEYLEEPRLREERDAKEKAPRSRTEQGVKEAKTFLLEKEEGVVIPIIKLEPVSEPVLRGLELSKEIPAIERRRGLSVPFIEIREPLIIARDLRLDCEIPRIDKRIRVLAIPIIRADSLPKVSATIVELDTEVWKPKFVLSKKISIPIYWKDPFIRPKLLIESLDASIDERLRKIIEKQEIFEYGSKVGGVEVEMGGAGSQPPGGEEVEDFLRFIFGNDGGKIRARGPKIILFKDLEDDSYISFLENICVRIYREREGGEPRAVKILKIDDMNKREIEKWLEAGGKIFTIDLERNDIPDETHLWERLEETYSERLGFIIFHVRSRERFNTLVNLLREINLKAQGRLNIVKLEARKLLKEVRRKVIELVSGMLAPEEIHAAMEVDGVPTISTFDYMINIALFNEDSLFNRVLENIKMEEGGLFKESTKPAEEESSLHFNIKVFLVRYLTHILREKGEKLHTREEIMRRIETEKELGPEVIADVVIGNEVYEVETLFGAGEEPDMKINRTIDKYDRMQIDKVNIVMDNLGFLLHLKDLLSKKKHFKDKRFKIEFYTLDLKNKRLISLEDFVREYKRLLKGIA